MPGCSGHPQGAWGEYCANAKDGASDGVEARRDQTPPGLRPGTQPCAGGVRLEPMQDSGDGRPVPSARPRRTGKDGQADAVSVRQKVFNLTRVRSNRLPSPQPPGERVILAKAGLSADNTEEDRAQSCLEFAVESDLRPLRLDGRVGALFRTWRRAAAVRARGKRARDHPTRRQGLDS